MKDKFLAEEMGIDPYGDFVPDEALDGLDEYYKEENDRLKKLVIPTTLKGIFKFKNNSFSNVLYRVKFLICFILKLEPKEKHGEWYNIEFVELDCIEDITLYAGWEATWCEVGYGLFSNWFYQIKTDSDWSM